MDTIEALDERIKAATIQLRDENFRKGFPFMMFSENLPDGEAYLEYPDGRIEVTRIDEAGNKNEMKLVKVLSDEEAKQVRREYGL